MLPLRVRYLGCGVCSILMDVLDQLARSTSPHLTWYADGGAERVELSGRVLTNWIIKATNFLDEEDVSGESIVGIDLPVHWRAAVWACAAWLRGARVRFREDGPDLSEADVVITNDPEFWAGGLETVIAVPLEPLALSWTGDSLPDDALDGAADLMSQPDVLISPVAVLAPNGSGCNERVALRPITNEWISVAIPCWAAGGSVVILHEIDEFTCHRLAQQEAARLTA